MNKLYILGALALANVEAALNAITVTTASATAVFNWPKFKHFCTQWRYRNYLFKQQYPEPMGYFWITIGQFWRKLLEFSILEQWCYSI